MYGERVVNVTSLLQVGCIHCIGLGTYYYRIDRNAGLASAFFGHAFAELEHRATIKTNRGMICFVFLLLAFGEIRLGNARPSVVDRHPLEAFQSNVFRRNNEIDSYTGANATCRFPSKPRCGGLPMLIMPSLIGNQLFATLTNSPPPHFWCWRNDPFYRIWLDDFDFVPYSPFQYCDLPRLKLEFISKGVYASPQGVNISAPYFGDLTGVNYLDSDSRGSIPVWSTVIDQLLQNGKYRAGVDVRSAPYDWRLGPDALDADGYFDKVRDLIVDMYATTGEKVVLASLSEGGPMTALLLQRLSSNFKAKYISGFVSLSGSFGGSLWSVIEQISSNLTLPYPNINPALLRETLQNWGGVACK